MQEEVVSDSVERTAQSYDNDSPVLRPCMKPPGDMSSMSGESGTPDSIEPEFLPLPNSNSSSSAASVIERTNNNQTSLELHSVHSIADANSLLSDPPPDAEPRRAAQSLEHGDDQDMDSLNVHIHASRSISRVGSHQARSNDTTPNSTELNLAEHDNIEIKIFKDMQAAFQSVLPHVKGIWQVNSIDNRRGSISIYKTALGSNPRSSLHSYNLRNVRQDDLQAIRQKILSRFSGEDETRVVFVRDLSPLIIELIYDVFRPSPEFFEQHLKGSMYGRYALPYRTEGSLRPSIWSTSLLPRSHCSLRWWRPVMLRPRNGLDNARWAALLEHGHTKRFTLRLKKENKTIDTRVVKVSNISRAKFGDMALFPDVTDNTRKTNEHSAESSHEGSDEAESVEKNEIVVTAYEERLTIHHSLRDGVALMVILTDPLPDVQQEREKQQSGGDDTPDEEWLPFTQVCPRGRPIATPDGALDYIRTFGQARDLKRYLTGTRPSESDILSWMSTDSGDEVANRQLGSWQAIMKVFETDTLCFLGIVLETLDTITEGITDETLLQDRLYEWRPLVTRYLLEIPRLRTSLLEFRSFMATRTISEQPQESIDKLSRRIDDAYLQTEKVYNSLRTEMSIIDSRRGIAEAEGVSKLTELAFVFIPITFAASIFSMQVKELETAPPLYAFIIAALLCVIISYAVRLSIRSDVLLNTKRQTFDNVRSRYGIPPNKSIPTRKFVAYVFYTIFNTFPNTVVSTIFPTERSQIVGYLLVMSAALSSGLSLIWTKSHLDVFFKAALTVLSVAMVLFQIWWTLPHKLSVTKFLASQLKQSQQHPLLSETDTMSV